jgi:replication factor A2
MDRRRAGCQWFRNTVRDCSLDCTPRLWLIFLLSADTYVRVTGQLKSFHNKPHVGAHAIRPVKDHNEVIFHQLEATAVHLYHTRGPPGGVKHVVSSGNAEPMDGVIHTNTKNIGFNQALDQYTNLSPLLRQIMAFVQSAPPTNEGIHVQNIAQGIQASSSTVLQAVEQLILDGILYTTIDDDHVHFPYYQ